MQQLGRISQSKSLEAKPRNQSSSHSVAGQQRMLGDASLQRSGSSMFQDLDDPEDSKFSQRDLLTMSQHNMDQNCANQCPRLFPDPNQPSMSKDASETRLSCGQPHQNSRMMQNDEQYDDYGILGQNSLRWRVDGGQVV